MPSRAGNPRLLIVRSGASGRLLRVLAGSAHAAAPAQRQMSALPGSYSDAYLRSRAAPGKMGSKLPTVGNRLLISGTASKVCESASGL